MVDIMSLQKTLEYNKIVEDILTHEEFLKLQHELHHGISRFEHSKRVSVVTFNLCKKLNLDAERVTRAALLNDFYTDSDTTLYNARETLKKHPEIALENACKYFDIDEVQKDIIEKHMFPATKELPSYKESFLVSMVDKAVAAHEMYRFKLSMYLGIFVVFVCNILAIQK